MASEHANRESEPAYDIALSFAGEDRPYVKQVAERLRSQGVRVFYDLFEEVDLWGKDLFVHLRNVYQRGAHYTVIFVSQAYVSKLWPRHERQSAQARAFEERAEYILPARFDDAELPGLPATIGYVDLRNKPPDELADLIIKKLRSSGISANRPAHASIQEDAALDPGHLSIALNPARRLGPTVAIRIDAYVNVGSLLDDLFLNYLADQFAPFTYGQSWVLTAGFAGYQWLVPWEWVRAPGQPVNRVASDWQSKSLAELCLNAGSHWEVARLSDNSNAKSPPLYVVACNDSNLGGALRNNPKAYAFLYEQENALRRVSLDAFVAADYRFIHVFRDWLDYGVSGAALVQSVPDICSRLAWRFGYRTSLSEE